MIRFMLVLFLLMASLGNAGNALAFDQGHLAKVRGRLPCYNCDLTRAPLAGANLAELDLTGTTLFGADLRGANMRETTLDKTDLRSVKIGGAFFEFTSFDGATMDGLNFSLATTWDTNSFNDTSCKGCSFAGDGINKAAVIKEADAQNMDLTGSNLSGASFVGCLFYKSKFNNTRIIGTYFSGDIIDSEIFQAVIKGSTIDSIVDGTQIFMSKIENTSFAGAKGTPIFNNKTTFKNVTWINGKTCKTDKECKLLIGIEEREDEFSVAKFDMFNSCSASGGLFCRLTRRREET